GYLLRPFLASLWPQGTAEWLRGPLGGAFGRSLPRDSHPGWVNPEFARRIGLDEIIRDNEEPRSGIRDPVRRARYRLIFTYMHMRGMVWSNRTWARFGLTFADPWSDRRLAELVLAMPQWRVQRPSEPKGIARRAMRGVMPESARRSVRKIVPYPLYEKALKDWSRETVEGLISGSRAAARGYLDEGALMAHYRAILRGEPEHSCFWWALTLEMWLRRYWG
ncbi:MAG: asparagine synthase-related protein, partial [Actinomycetota bacterium]